MKIHISQISEDEGLKIKHTYPEGELALRGGDARLTGKTALELQARRERERVELTGRLKASVEIDCDRCLDLIAIPVDQEVDLLYIPPAKSAGNQEEKELGEDDLSIGFYQDQVIDIDDLVREQIELALPMSRICRDDCRGLCPECGANLNEGGCDCAVEQPDPRWAALKGLKAD